MADVSIEAHDEHDTGPRRPRIGCNEAEAIRYMGCTVTMFQELRAKGVIVPVRKGYYSYRLLDLAMEQLEEAALKEARAARLFATPKEPKKKGDASEPLSTHDLLAKLKADGQT